MISAILFDLDGVILDSNPVIELFWAKWAEREGVPFNAQVVKEKIHGRTTWETIHALFEKTEPARKQEIYDDGIAYDLTMEPELMAGVKDFISDLSVSGLPFCLVTSSDRPRAWHFLKQHGLDGYFTSSVTGDEVTKGKPDPEPYLKGAAKLGIDPADCLVFEDSDSGIKSALTAGMRVISVNNSSYKGERILWNIRNFRELKRAQRDLHYLGEGGSGSISLVLP